MKETKFYQFMETLSPVEMNRLTKFMESPYFTKNEKLLKIYYAVESHIRDIKSGDLNKKDIWDQIYPQLKYEDEKFRKHCSKLIELIESWLSIEAYLDNPLNQAKNLLESIHNNRIEKLASAAITSVKSLMLKQNLKPANHYLNKFEIEILLYKLDKLEEARLDKNKSENINFEIILRNLDIFYIAEKLKYYSTILSWLKIKTISDNILFIEEIIELSQNEIFSEVPVIAIYSCIYYTYMDSENEEHYFKLKELIFKHIELFPKEEARSILEAAMNYAISKINMRQEKYYRELFELHKNALNQEILILNNEISQWTFKNIVANALRLKEFEWVENFIPNYSIYLNVKIKNNAVTFNNATLLFSKRKFKDVLELLQKVQYEEIFYALGSKAMILSSYFELDEVNALNSFIDSFKLYLQRNKEISKLQKSYYLSLIYFTKQLLIANKTKKQLLLLKTELSNSSPVGKEWLLEKIDEQIAVAKPDPVKKKKKRNS